MPLTFRCENGAFGKCISVDGVTLIITILKFPQESGNAKTLVIQNTDLILLGAINQTHS